MRTLLASLPLALLCLASAAHAQQCRLLAPAHARAGAPGSSSAAPAQATATTGTATAGTAGHTSATSASVTATSAGATASTSALPPFNYGTTPIRGANLGGWFVLEPWITPSIFENTGNTSIIDEYTLGQSQNNATTRAIMQNHWDTWITEDDFDAMAAAGLNHVRIPIGYWSVPITSASTKHSTDPSPYIPGAWPYLLRALGWAQAHGIYVIVDLHGAPYSQNGYDNSGHLGTPAWANSGNDGLARTVDLLAFMAQQLAGQISVLELVNEAGGWVSGAWADAIRGFWQDGYAAVRKQVGNSMNVMIGDAFLGVNSWQNFLTPPTATGVLMDWHMYQIFSQLELARSWDEHVSYACGLIPNLSSFASNNLHTVSGEWSTAPTDCAKWLNGRGVGARWDGTWQSDTSIHFGSCDGWTGSYSTFSDDYKTFLRKYWEVQVTVGESVQGWIFWCWKAENADEWSYQKGLEGGWIPKDPTDRLYPNICSN